MTLPLTCTKVDKRHDSGDLTLLIKGAPERVLKKCSTYSVDGRAEPIDEEFKKAFDNAYDVRFCLLSFLI